MRLEISPISISFFETPQAIERRRCLLYHCVFCFFWTCRFFCLCLRFDVKLLFREHSKEHVCVISFCRWRKTRHGRI